MDEIVKIRYSTSHFDVDKRAMGRREVYEIFPDGRMTLRCYQCGSRECLKKEERQGLSAADFHLLCAKLLDCISHADRVIEFIDDSDGTLKLYYRFGRVDTMPRGYGNKQQDVGTIVSRYLFQISNIS